MTERSGAIDSARETREILMATHGTPDTGSTKSLAFTDTAAAVTGLLVDKWYRLIATEDCFIHFHAAEDATTSHMFLNAGVSEFFYTGNLTRISAIRSTASGTLYLTAMQTNNRVT